MGIVVAAAVVGGAFAAGRWTRNPSPCCRVPAAVAAEPQPTPAEPPSFLEAARPTSGDVTFDVVSATSTIWPA